MIAVRKLPARYAPIVMPFVLSILMTAVVSVISTLRSLGATPAFLATWPGAWAVMARRLSDAACGAADSPPDRRLPCRVPSQPGQ